MTPSVTPPRVPMMRPALRWALIAAGCAAGVVAWLPEDEVAVVVPTRAGATRIKAGFASSAAASAPTTSAAAASADVAPDQSADSAESARSSQASNAGWPPLSRAAQAAWVPLPPPPRAQAPAVVASVAAPEPTPSFPYQWIGEIDEAGQVRVFLVDAQRLWAVAPGETVAPGWRVDTISAGSLQLTWLATGAVVQLAARP